MELFPLDLLAGSALVIGILIILLGIGIWRYRGGHGPVILALSGAVFTLTSLTRVAGFIAGKDLSPIPLYAGFSLAAILLLSSLLLWRKRM
jgi:hypothetical protein